MNPTHIYEVQSIAEQFNLAPSMPVKSSPVSTGLHHNFNWKPVILSAGLIALFAWGIKAAKKRKKEASSKENTLIPKLQPFKPISK